MLFANPHLSYSRAEWFRKQREMLCQGQSENTKIVPIKTSHWPLIVYRWWNGVSLTVVMSYKVAFLSTFKTIGIALRTFCVYWRWTDVSATSQELKRDSYHLQWGKSVLTVAGWTMGTTLIHQSPSVKAISTNPLGTRHWSPVLLSDSVP